MALRLVCEPGKTVPWNKFRFYPARSIAVDGYCNSRPRSSADGLRLNIDHHREVDRSATRSSCDQALIRVKMGLYRDFQVDGCPDATIYVNDCDQDVALATYVLLHPEHADRPKLKLLMRVEDLLDMSSGLFPIRNNRKSHVMRQLTWITQPYTRIRSTGRHKTLTADQMKEIILQMHRRIRRSLFGRVPELELDTSFESESRGLWSLVRETGTEARIGMAEAGIKAFVSVLCEHGGIHHYSLGRSLNFPFPIPQICAALNTAESIGDDDSERWGGSNICGGSPRDRGSRLTPNEVADIVDGVLADAAKKMRSAH